MSFKLNEHTGVLIKKAARLFERVSNINLEKLGVTYVQTTFLVRLWEKDGQNQTELTKSSGLRQPTVVRILDRMERDKLVKRVRSKDDGRVYYFFLTEKGKKASQELMPQGEMMQKIATSTLNKKSIEQLNQHILDVINNLEEFIENLHICEKSDEIVQC